MGWNDSHLFEFQIGDKLYGEPPLSCSGKSVRRRGLSAPDQGQANVAGNIVGKIQNLSGQMEALRLQISFPVKIEFSRRAPQGFRPRELRDIDSPPSVAA